MHVQPTNLGVEITLNGQKVETNDQLYAELERAAVGEIWGRNRHARRMQAALARRLKRQQGKLKR